MDFAKLTQSQFDNYFIDEKTCYEFLEAQRWEGTPVCPHCGSIKKPYSVKPRSKSAELKDTPHYRCSEKGCQLPFTVRTGTIFEGSKVTLKLWFKASYELSVAKKSISSLELASRLGVSQKTAWFINHRLRNMLADTAPELLEGEVEVVEIYVGGLEKNKHKSKRMPAGTTGAKGKAPMVGFKQRDGKVILRVINKDQANTQGIAPLVRKYVSPNAILITDGFGAYTTVGKEYAGHEVVNHTAGEYVRAGKWHTNNMEGFWSQLKRGIIGTFHFVSHKHLQRYCDEFAYKHNNKSISHTERFANTLKNATNTKLTYRTLTAKGEA